MSKTYIAKDSFERSFGKAVCYQLFPHLQIKSMINHVKKIFLKVGIKQPDKYAKYDGGLKQNSKIKFSIHSAGQPYGISRLK